MVLRGKKVMKSNERVLTRNCNAKSVVSHSGLEATLNVGLERHSLFSPENQRGRISVFYVETITGVVHE